MTPKLLLSLLLAGLLWVPLSANTASVSASITIPVALDIQLPEEKLVLPESLQDVAELPIEIATNDWPLTLTIRYAYESTPPVAARLALRFVADRSSEESSPWWAPEAVDDVFTGSLPLHGRQTYTLLVRRLEGVVDERLPSSMTLIIESWSGKIVMCDVKISPPGSVNR